ncbi:DUF6817 domain-containing protein [Streptomyces monashensis]|uniref:DUF6817 domain-containing protein n=1 Tax=Streptomyces monashensis TaxID=1678012 RepID=UPI003409D91B
MASARRHHLTDREQQAVEVFLRDRGAALIPHPGGTLLEHLERVHRLLADWGADSVVRTAGLCHATYGTDGFGPTLLPVTDRTALVALIGQQAEELVYFYACCDRAATYPRLDGTEAVVFRNRFTGRDHQPPAGTLRAFLTITAANELDVLAHNADLARQHGPGLYRLLTRVGPLLPPAARDAVARRLG